MEPMYYIGLDVHKKKISYCVKDGNGRFCAEGWIVATIHTAPRRRNRRFSMHRLARRAPRVPLSVKKRKWKPPANHPWHEPARPKVQKRAAKMAAGRLRPSLAWPSASP